jgi:hypothetical protein
MMALDEGNPAPPPAPVARLPRLPSNAEIVRPRNADVSLLILRAVLSRGTMMGDRKLESAAPPIRGNNQLMVIVGGGGDKRGGGLWGIG